MDGSTEEMRKVDWNVIGWAGMRRFDLQIR